MILPHACTEMRTPFSALQFSVCFQTSLLGEADLGLVAVWGWGSLPTPKKFIVPPKSWLFCRRAEQGWAPQLLLPRTDWAHLVTFSSAIPPIRTVMKITVQNEVTVFSGQCFLGVLLLTSSFWSEIVYLMGISQMIRSSKSYSHFVRSKNLLNFLLKSLHACAHIHVSPCAYGDHRLTADVFRDYPLPYTSRISQRWPTQDLCLANLL